MLHIQSLNIYSESRCRCGVERSNNNRIIGGIDVDKVRCVKVYQNTFVHVHFVRIYVGRICTCTFCRQISTPGW